MAEKGQKSKQPGKKRDYSSNAGLHIKQKQAHTHLSQDWIKQHGTRSVQIRKGDKIKVMRGDHKGKIGKVDSVSLKSQKVIVEGIEKIKTDGSKVQIKLTPSNLLIMELNTSDKKRLNVKTKTTVEEKK